MPSVNFQTYKNLVKQNWVDGGIDDSKVGMLSNLRKTLGVSDDEHELILTDLGSSAGGPAPAVAGDAPVNVSGTPTNVSDAPVNVSQTPVNSSNGPALALPEKGTAETGRYLRDMDFNDQGYSAPATPEPGGDANTSATSGITRVSPAPEAPVKDPDGKPDAGLSGGESPEKLLEIGKDAFRKGEYQKALDLCDQVLSMKPNNSQATFFKKRAKSKLDESGGGTEAAAAPEETSDPMMAHTQTAATPNPAAAGVVNPKCLSCRDTEVCSWCKGTGVCWMCHGGSQCSACKGTGIIDGQTCNKCKGSGECDSCLGSGKCYWCKGSGKCHKCQR